MLPLAWDDFRLVKTIAEHRSLGPAAEALKLNHSTVFRKLNALEEQLGMRIFERSRSGYVLTGPGEEMLVIASQMADAVQDFERRAAGMDARPTGILRVTTTDIIFTHFLTPILKDFREQFPGIVLDMLIDNRTLNLARRDADVAIRASQEPPETLVGRRLSEIAWAVYGPKGIEFDRSVPLFEADLKWVGFGEIVSPSSASRWFSQKIPASKIVMRTDTIGAKAAAVRAGFGVSYLPCFFGDQMPDLERISPLIPEAASALWILTHPDLRRSVRIRAFLDFVGAEISKRKKLMEGEGIG